MNEGLRLDRVIFTGRTYGEYVRMFNLDEIQLASRSFFLCPGGASSFPAIANRQGTRVRAGDILYGRSLADLRQRGEATLALLRERMDGASPGFRWEEFGGVEGLLRERAQALEDFLADYADGVAHGRYVPCTLPDLTLADGEADVILSDHLLFTYPELFDYAFHLQSLRAMIRAARLEVRIFPVVSSADGTKPSYLGDLLARLNQADTGCRAELEKVPYHFQTNSTEMLRIRKIR